MFSPAIVVCLSGTVALPLIKVVSSVAISISLLLISPVTLIVIFFLAISANAFFTISVTSCKPAYSILTLGSIYTFCDISFP